MRNSGVATANKYKTEVKFMLDKGDYEKLRDYLDIDWDELLVTRYKTTDETWEDFKAIIHQGMYSYI